MTGHHPWPPPSFRNHLARMRRRHRERRGEHSYWMARGYAALRFDPYQQEPPIDKATWGEGPWRSEPDRVFWQHESGLSCAVMRGDVTGSWCGYVRLPKGHPWQGRAWGAIDADVHGGITFVDTFGADCWIGFDCAHYGDCMPAIEGRLWLVPGRADPVPLSPFTYRDLSFAVLETERLAAQVSVAISNG